MSSPGSSAVRGAGSARFWAYAAAFGALWAAMEAVLGVFLHSLRIPLTGVVLAAFAAALMAAQRRLANLPGLTLATGWIVAICRLFVPSPVVLGPMVAITMEALLMEAAFLAAGRGFVAAGMAGFLAAFWSISQGLLMQLVYYGKPVFELYVSLAKSIVEWFAIPVTAAWACVVLVGSAVGFIGIIGGVWGSRLGKRLAAEPPASESCGSAVRRAADLPAARPPGQHCGGMAAALLWLCAMAFIGSQWLPGILWSTLALGLWLAVLHVTRPDVTRRMWKPRFWGFTFVVALLAGFFLGAKDLELGWLRLSTTGLVSGVEMLLRAAFVMSVALLANAALSSGRFEKARRFLGPARLWESVQTATALLPDLMESLGGRFWRGGRLLTLLRQARGLAEGSAVRPHTPLAIGLYGSPGTGKTTFLTTLAQMLTEAQMSVGGIVQPAVEPGEALLDAPTPRFRSGQAAGAYDLLDLATGERRRLATKRASRDGCTQTGCDFDHAAWSWAAARLAEAARTCDVVILDELGRLEAGGMGHLPGLLAAMAGSQCRYWILGIRLQALEAMVLAFPHPLVPLSVERTDLSALVRGLRLGA